MRGQFVQHQVLDVVAEGIAVHRSIEHPRPGNAGEAQSGNKGHCFQLSDGPAPAAARQQRLTLGPRHLGVDAGIAEKDEARITEEGLRAAPQLASGCDGRPDLLARMQTFFERQSEASGRI